MKVTAIQTTVCTEIREKGTLSDVLRDMEEGFTLMEKAIKEGSKLLVTIEGSNKFGNPTDSDVKEKITQINEILFPRYLALSEKGACIVAGLYTTDGNRLFNSAVVFDSGKLLGEYHKIHLPADELGITPGEEYLLFETSVGKVAPMVCWDMQFPEAGRILAMKGADIITCPTWGWEDIFRCRAYENSLPMIAAMGVVAEMGKLFDECDPSCIIDYWGHILSQGNRHTACAVTAELEIGADPAPQYGSEKFTGHHSMRRTRLCQRRPDTYGYLTEEHPALYQKYEKE